MRCRTREEGCVGRRRRGPTGLDRTMGGNEGFRLKGGDYAAGRERGATPRKEDIPTGPQNLHKNVSGSRPHDFQAMRSASTTWPRYIVRRSSERSAAYLRWTYFSKYVHTYEVLYSSCHCGATSSFRTCAGDFPSCMAGADEGCTFVTARPSLDFEFLDC